MRDPVYLARRRVISLKSYRNRLLKQGVKDPARLEKINSTITRNFDEYRALKTLMIEIEGDEIDGET